MIALLAQFAFGMAAVYGIWTATMQMGLAVICWYGRRWNAQQARLKAEGDSRAREVANTWMLSRLTEADHTEIERIIHDSQTEAA